MQIFNFRFSLIHTKWAGKQANIYSPIAQWFKELCSELPEWVERKDAIEIKPYNLHVKPTQILSWPMNYTSMGENSRRLGRKQQLEDRKTECIFQLLPTIGETEFGVCVQPRKLLPQLKNNNLQREIRQSRVSVMCHS